MEDEAKEIDENADQPQIKRYGNILSTLECF